METKADDATDFTCSPDAQLIAEFEAIEQAAIAELVADGATPERAASELAEFCQEVTRAFDRAPLIGATCEGNWA